MVMILVVGEDSGEPAGSHRLQRSARAVRAVIDRLVL